MKNQCVDFINICGIVIIVVCVSSLRYGYSIIPIVIILLQILVLIINNLINGKK
jgi:hypothetical protein